MLEEKKMDEYIVNLKAFKKLIEDYTIADLKSMIYEVKDKQSGGCCYPAVQTLFSLMELISKLLSSDKKDDFVSCFTKIGNKYNDKKLAKKLYKYFRHGIAHNSLAMGGVKISKAGNKTFHLSNNGMNINVKIMFEDFLPFFHEVFDKTLQNSKYISEYKRRLKDIFTELKIKPISNIQKWGGLEISANYTRTNRSTIVTTVSGTELPKINSNVSTTQIKVAELKS